MLGKRQIFPQASTQFTAKTWQQLWAKTWQQLWVVGAVSFHGLSWEVCFTVMPDCPGNLFTHVLACLEYSNDDLVAVGCSYKSYIFTFYC